VSTRRGPALVLFPGAGSSSDHPALVAIERASPWPTVRADFPYRRAGRRAPDRPAVLLTCVVEEVAVLGPGPVVLAGRSMGGRICSLAVAGGLVEAIGLVLISYPLHPPGRPDRLRVEHFGRIEVPTLFVSGTRDPFGTPAEFEEHLAAIVGPVTWVPLDGLGHDLRGADETVAGLVADFLRTLPVPGRRRSRG